MPTDTKPKPYSPEWLNSLSDEEKKAVAKSSFGVNMHNSGGQHVTWLLWSCRKRSPWAPVERRQASIFFLDCGKGPFAVTAGHVYEQFLNDIQSSKVIDCQIGGKIGNIGFDLAKRLIAMGKNQGIDIATFRISDEEIKRLEKKVLRGADGVWPPPPNPGEIMFFGGFPGVERDMVGYREYSFGLHSGMNPLTDFTEYQIRCRFERQYWVDVRGQGLPPVGYDLGGVSGGPLLVPTYQNGSWGWRLAGVISEAIMQEGFEVITAVRAHFILPDGRLAR